LNRVQQLLRIQGRRSKLSNDDSTGVIRDICGFDRRRTAAECEREQSDCGIARTGDVEDLARAIESCLALDRATVRASARRRLGLDAALDRYEQALERAAR